jgi:hypothetical protein
MALRHKFNAQSVVTDGVRYASKKEARYAAELKLREKAGEIVFHLEQVPIKLPGGTKLVVDFLEFHADGTARFVDVKGMETPEFKIKRREVEALYPITIHTV